MHSFLNKTILNNYIDVKLFRSNLFILKLKLTKKSKNAEQMIISSCSNSNNFDLLSKSKMKTPLFLKTFNSIQTALNELEIDEETFLILFYYKNFFLKRKFKKLKLYLKVMHLVNFFYIISSLSLIRWMKKIKDNSLNSKINNISYLNLRK